MSGFHHAQNECESLSVTYCDQFTFTLSQMLRLHSVYGCHMCHWHLLLGLFRDYVGSSWLFTVIFA